MFVLMARELGLIEQFRDLCLDKLVGVLFEDILIYCNSKEEQVECLRIELQVLKGKEVL